MKEFESAKGWVVSLFGSVILVCCPLWRSENRTSISLWVTIGVIVLVFNMAMTWMRRKTTYRFNENDMFIVSVFNAPMTVCSASEIISVARTWTIISAPAPGYPRIKIKHKQGKIIISPKDELAFKKHLKSLNKNIEIG